MGLLNNIMKYFGYIPKNQQVVRQLSDIWDREYGIDAASKTEEYIDQYGDSGWIYACANRIAKKAASAAIHFYDETAGEEKEEVEHIFRDVLKQPNELLSEYELRFLLHLHLETAGEAFWYIGENEMGGPGVIFPLMPSYVKVVPGNDELIKGYMYGKGHDKMAYDLDEVIHFKYPNPDPQKFFRGASPVKAARYAIATSQKAVEWNYNFFKNGAKPGGYLKTDKKINKSEQDRLLKMWKQAHQGTDKAHKIGLAQQGMEFDETGINQEDMDFVNQLTNTRDKILAIYGVPKSILGLVEDVNRANARADKENFAEQTIDPVNVLVASTLTQFLKKNYDERLLVDFETVAPADREYRLDKYETELEYNVSTINEIRAEQGKEPVSWGDNPPNPQRLMGVTGASMVQQENVDNIEDFQKYLQHKKKRESNIKNYMPKEKIKIKDGKNIETELPNVRTDISGF